MNDTCGPQEAPGVVSLHFVSLIRIFLSISMHFHGCSAFRVMIMFAELRVLILDVAPCIPVPAAAAKCATLGGLVNAHSGAGKCKTLEK